jgi:hypothetical protein
MVTRILIALCLLATVAQGQVVRKILRPDLGATTNGTGLVAWWPIEDNKANDKAGGANLALSNSPDFILSSPTGVAINGGGLPTPKYAAIENSTALDYLNPPKISIAWWARIRAVDTPQNGSVISLRVLSGDEESFDCNVASNYFRVIIWQRTPAVAKQLIGFPVNPVGTWHHYAFTDDGTNTVIYFDGLPLTNSATVAIRSNVGGAKNLRLLRNAYDPANDRLFYGFVGEVKIFNRILTSQEVRTIFTSRRPTQ